MIPEDILISFYKEKKSKGQIFSERIESLGCYNKLGESIMISSIPEKAFKENKNITLNIDNNYYLNLVLKNNPHFRNGNTKFYTIHHLVENYNFGNGNILQQIYMEMTCMQLDLLVLVHSIIIFTKYQQQTITIN
jgi:hypothetical protein